MTRQRRLGKQIQSEKRNLLLYILSGFRLINQNTVTFYSFIFRPLPPSIIPKSLPLYIPPWISSSSLSLPSFSQLHTTTLNHRRTTRELFYISFIIHTPVFEKPSQTEIEMGSIPPQLLPFDSRPPSFLSKPIADFLTEVSMAAGNVPHRASKLDALLNRLEDEMRKIDAFKRELPLCMHLLNDAIVALKDESMRFSTRNAEPVLEEFIPMKDNRSDDDEDDDGESITTRKENESTDSNKDKKSWMSSVQLWNNDEDCHSVQKNTIETRREIEESFKGFKTGGGTKSFVPFKVSEVRKEEMKELQVQELSFLTSGVKNLKEESDSTGSRNSFRRVVSSDPNLKPTFRSGQQQQQQTARKPRRCWSPELHRRFVSALHQLGGCQVATPKQIRELMQVNGLTNDEVKSHLQKYRLHTRRMPAPANQPMVVLGSGLWLSQDQHADSLKASNSQSSSPEGPLQLATNARGANSMDDDEDTKSGSCSWKSNVNMAVKEEDV